MGQFSDLFKTLMWIGLVIFSFMSFINLFQAENAVESSQQFTNNSFISNTFTRLSDNLSDTRTNSQNQKELFETENPTAGFGSILLFSILSAGRVFNSMIVTTFNTIVTLPTVVWGIDPIVIGIISTIFLFMIIFGLWAVYKLGG